MLRISIAAIFIYASQLVLVVNAQTLTLDHAVTYQEMDGFGMQGYGEMSPQFLHDDLGLNIIRSHLQPKFQPERPADLYNGDISLFRQEGIQWALDNIADFGQWDDMKYWMAIFTPPGWMKDMSRDHWSEYYDYCSDGEDACAGHLRADMREALAGYMVGAYKRILQKTGVKLYGMSIQNEPAFPEWYVSCIYTPEEYRDALKVVGKRFEDEGIDIKLIGPEDMAAAATGGGRPYFGYINADPEAKKYLDIAAVHGYIDGINPYPSSSGATIWSRVGMVAQSMGKPTWMSETSGFSNDWNGAVNLSGTIYLALKYANISGWVFLNDNDFAFPSSNSHSVLSAVSKNFYRYIRPGAVRISAELPSEGNQFAVAFNHPQNKTLTIVILNEAATEVQIDLSGDVLPQQMARYTTTNAKLCSDDGMVETGAMITLDANSVTTLYGTGYSPPTVETARPTRLSVNTKLTNTLQKRAFSLDGRCISKKNDKLTGIYIEEYTKNYGFYQAKKVLAGKR